MSVVSKSQYYTGFDPRQLSNCALWLDAADRDSFTFSSGSNITFWKDKSGSAYDASAIGVPTRAAGPTGRTGVFFDGTDNFVGTASNTTTVLTGFIVADMSSNTTNDGRIVSLGQSGIGQPDFNSLLRTPLFLRNGAGTQQIRTFRNNGTLGIVNITYNTPFVATSLFNASSNTIYRDGTAGTSVASSGSFGYSNYGIGRDPGSAGDRHVGYVYEVILYNQALGSNDRQSVEGYLAWKWGLNSSLLSNHIYRRVPNVTRPFSPTDLGSNLGLWLDATDVNTLTLSGANVTTWLDKSGNNRHLVQATAGNRPTYVTSNPRDAYVEFVAASSQFLDISDATNLAVSRSFSIFVVEQRTASNSTNYIFGGNTGSGGSNLHIGYRTDTTATLAFWANDLDATISNYATNSNTRVWNFEYTGSSQVIYANGSNLNSRAASSLAAWPGAAMGRMSNLNAFYNGRIREVVWCTPSLTTAQRQQVEGYLAWKWGRQSDLISTNLFKLYYPLASSFNPLLLSNCELWYDAAEFTSLTFSSGSNISQWSDKSGNARNATQASVGNQPVLSNTPRNFPVVGNTGSSGLTGTLTVNGLTNMTIFVVCNTTSATEVAVNNGRLLFYIAETGSWGSIQMYISQTRLDWRFGTGQAGNAPTFNLPSNVSTNYNIVSISKASTQETGFLNGTNIASYTAANTTIANTSNAFFITGPSLSSTYSANNIAEFLVYTSAITASQRQAIEGYLAWKWGLQGNLPTSHPYKTTRP